MRGLADHKRNLDRFALHGEGGIEFGVQPIQCGNRFAVALESAQPFLFRRGFFDPGIRRGDQQNAAGVDPAGNIYVTDSRGDALLMLA